MCSDVKDQIENKVVQKIRCRLHCSALHCVLLLLPPLLILHISALGVGMSHKPLSTTSNVKSEKHHRPGYIYISPSHIMLLFDPITFNFLHNFLNACLNLCIQMDIHTHIFISLCKKKAFRCIMVEKNALQKCSCYTQSPFSHIFLHNFFNFCVYVCIQMDIYTHNL